MADIQVGNKRKFDSVEQSRSTGFSAPTKPVGSESNAPQFHNSVQTQAEEMRIAKEKAQEMVNRLLMSKRTRVDEEPVVSSSIPHSESPHSHSTLPGIGTGTGPYAFQARKIEVPVAKVGLIIGKGGQTIKYLNHQSGARIQVLQDKFGTDPCCMTKQVELTGSLEQMNRAQQLINDVIAGSDAAGIPTVQTGGTEQVQIKVPNKKVGLVIGKGGETIKDLQTRSGARIQVIPLRLPPGDTSTERTVYMNGTKEQIQAAQQMINQVINNLNPGYGQQGYRAPQQWGPQVYNGYQQQYVSQGYPHQAQSGYGNGPPPPAQSGGYDYNYYGQQGPSGAAVAYGNYGYGQLQGGGYEHQISGYSQQGYGNGNDTSQQGTINAQQVYQVTAQSAEGHPSEGSSQQSYGQPVQPQQGYSQPGYPGQGASKHAYEIKLPIAHELQSMSKGSK